MNKRKEYFFSSYQGKCLLPNYKEVKKSDFSNQPHTLIPDNNVCTHISDLNNDKQDKIKRVKAKNFLKYVSQSKITVDPSWGLLERASKPGTLNLNESKLKNFEDAFWKQLNVYTDNRINSHRLDDIKYALYPIYAYLLKIKLILTKREPSAKNAQTNIEDLYNFAEELKLVLIIPWQFAVAIFGGNTGFNNLIKPKKKCIFLGLWSAAWDMYYLQSCHEFYGIRKINNSYPQFIFATDDEACANISSVMKVIGGIDYGRTILNQTLLSFDFPHWNKKDSFLSEVFFKINDQAIQRQVKREFISEEEEKNDIQMVIDRSEQHILELTQELKNFHNKGFNHQ